MCEYVCVVGNHRSALSDATEAHKIDPEYMKAILRGKGPSHL